MHLRFSRLGACRRRLRRRHRLLALTILGLEHCLLVCEGSTELLSLCPRRIALMNAALPRSDFLFEDVLQHADAFAKRLSLARVRSLHVQHMCVDL